MILDWKKSFKQVLLNPTKSSISYSNKVQIVIRSVDKIFNVQIFLWIISNILVINKTTLNCWYWLSSSKAVQAKKMKEYEFNFQMDRQQSIGKIR